MTTDRTAIARTTTDLLIVGTGLAGLAAALTAKERAPGIDVVLLEKNAKPGRKFLLAGSGQCNITHAGDVRDFFSRYGSHARFVQPALLEYPNTKLIDFLTGGGIALEELENGKIFPVSRKGVDILSLFLRKIDESGIRLRYGESARKIERDESGLFRVVTDDTVFSAPALILATGGCSWPQCGTTGDGYRYARELGHTIVPPRPALTPVVVEEWRYADCSGIAVPVARAQVVRGARRIARFGGDVLFTRDGLSGPGILDASRDIRSGDRLVVSWCGDRDSQSLERALQDYTGKAPVKEVASILAGFDIPRRLVLAVFRENGIPKELRGDALDRKTRARLATLFAEWSCTVRCPVGFERAMVTAGGVALDEVDRKSMESRKLPGLYFAGELLDIDGDTGGYNLQFAWSSGSLAGRAAVRDAGCDAGRS